MSNLTLANPVGVVVSSDKGDVANRLECAGAHLKNNLSKVAKDVVVIGGTAAAGAAVLKSESLANFIGAPAKKAFTFVSNFVTGAVTSIGNMIKSTKFGENALNSIKNKIQNITPNQKNALLAIGIVGAGILSRITYNHLFKKGQIDQKYTDKAAAKEAATKAIG